MDRTDKVSNIIASEFADFVTEMWKEISLKSAFVKIVESYKFAYFKSTSLYK